MTQIKYLPNTLFICIALSCLFFSNCQKDKDPCPDETSVVFDEFPPEVFEFNPFQDLDTLVYVSENYDSLNFTLYDSGENAIVNYIFQKECKEDPEQSITINYDAVQSGYRYKTNNGDTLKISFTPFLNYNPNGYSVEEGPQIRITMLIFLKLAATNENISTAPVIHTYAPFTLQLIQEPDYELNGYSHSNVYDFLTRSEQTRILFNKMSGLIGFTDSASISWILAN